MAQPIHPLSEAAGLLRQVMESSDDLIFVKDRDGKYVACNKSYGELFDSTPEELIGHGIELFGDPEVTKKITAIDNQLFETGEGSHERGPRTLSNGETRWFDVVKSPVFDNNGSVTGLTCVARDVTRQRQIEELLENQNTWLGAINDATIGMIRTPDVPVDTERLVRSLARLTGTSFASMYVEPSPITIQAKERAGIADDGIDLRGEVGSSELSVSARLSLAKTTLRTLTTQVRNNSKVHVIPMNDAGVRNGVLLFEWATPPPEVILARAWSVARQVGVLLINRSLIDRTKYLASHDELTGLSNRHHLTQQLDRALTQRREDERPVAVIFADLDGFKEVNDKWGHHVGDLLLCEVAERLRKTIRYSDTLARLGGDEFALVVPNGDRAICAGFFDRISQAVAKPFELGVGEPVNIGLSIGFARTPEVGATTAAELMIAADKAMYEQKERRLKTLVVTTV